MSVTGILPGNTSHSQTGVLQGPAKDNEVLCNLPLLEHTLETLEMNDIS